MMAIAHVCTQCGVDLARVRSRRDPHYGLPLVICPACQHACVRRRHPMAQAWRKYRTIDLAFLVIALQLLMAAASSGTIVAMAVAAAVHDFKLPFDPDARLIVLCFVAGIALLNGCWLTLGFSHLRWPRVWLGWTAIGAFLLFVLTFTTACMGDGPGIDKWDMQGMTFATRLWYAITEQYFPWLLLLLAIMAASVVGIVPGKFILRFLRSFQSRRWRRRRRRFRVQRSGL